MRVIAGKAKHIPLETIKGDATRPTTDRIKETLFNMLQPYVACADFLDLFAGSGQMGIEALSRGAASATFIEKNPAATSCIKNNLAKTHLTPANVLESDVIRGLRSLKQPYDIIFMDPPYALEIEREVLCVIAEEDLLRQDGLIIIEAAIEHDFSYVTELGFSITREKKYKTNKHVFITINPPADETVE